jgi:glucan phosphoethanolaminetransferase (alkaline phosphatase superfamily)
MKTKKNILVIIDTLRAYHLGCYGYEKNSRPNIKDLSNVGFFF